MSEPEEAKELRLVNNVELKIALADTDAKLQRLLNLYLAPLLLKLGSPHLAVRNKVISVCQHVNTRVKSATLILPIAALLTQFKDPVVGGVHPLVRNFDLMYITTGIDRIPISERLELLPVIIAGISTHGNDHHQRSLFNVLLRLLPHFPPPPRGGKDDIELRDKLNFTDDPRDVEWLSTWFAKLMLLNLNMFAPQQPSALERAISTRTLGVPRPQARPADPASARCAGLIASDIDFLTLGRKEETFSPVSVLAEIKVAVLRFLASGAFTDRERFFPTLIASVDTNSAVAEPAEDIFKRASTAVSLEDDPIVDELYNLLLGSQEAPSVKPTLQVKIISLLSKSRRAVEASHQRRIEKIVKLGVEAQFAKLRQAIFEFINWVSRMASNELMHSLTPKVVKPLQEALMPSSETADHLRGYAFETYGLVVSRCMPIVIESKLKIIRFLFRRLKDSPAGILSSIERAMGTILTAVSKETLSEDAKSELRDLIMEVVIENGRGSGQAVKWSNKVLGFGSTEGRWIAALAVGMGGAVGEEGGKALHPYYYRLINPEISLPLSEAMDVDNPDGTIQDKYAFPEFLSVAFYFFSVPHVLPKSFASGGLVNGKLPVKSFAAALAFVKQMAYWEAFSASSISKEFKITEDWDRNVDAAVTADSNARAAVESYFTRQLENEARRNATQILLDEAWAAMIYDGHGIDEVSGIWNELAVLVPVAMMERFVLRLSQIEKLLHAPKAAARRTAAICIGLVGSDPHVELAVLVKLIEQSIAGAENSKDGSVLALGFLLSRLQLRSRLGTVDKVLVERGVKAVSDCLIKSSDAVATEAAVEALIELEAFAVMDRETIDSKSLLEKLESRAKKGDEKSLIALAYLAFIYPEGSPETTEILDKLCALGESGGVETAFSVGEALASSAASWASSAVRRGRTLAGVSGWTGPRRNIGSLLEQMLTRAQEPAGGGKRRVTCLSLLSIIEFVGENSEVQSSLKLLQQVFRTFLTDRDAFIQESAARGLTAVYDLSDEETRSELVGSLVSSFTGEKKEKITVSRDTQLFEPGQLPIGDGTSVGSYGDIMSLAAELGDPSLVYKFMSLAQHNSLWSSRAAFGRFGLGRILRGSEVVENRRLWPVLFRYMHDPNTGVKSSMRGIWEALGGNAEIIEKWWKEICEDCLKGSVNGKEWRVRESSLGALSELLSGRKVTQYKIFLEDIWKVAFRVLDDVKGSVRLAAEKLCKVLIAGSVRMVGSTESSDKEKQEILEVLMRFLVGRQGLEADAQETQLFALDTLLKLVKKGGETLRPWVPELVEKMIMLLSDLEGPIEYIRLNAEKYNTTGEDIDRVRLNLIRQSPVMSTLEELLDTLDAPTTASLVPVLTKCVRTSIGLPSKVGCARIMVSMVMRKPLLLTPYADQLLSTCVGAIKDRSETVATTYAAAAGYLCRLASDQAVLGMIAWSHQSYWEGEEAERRAVGRTISEFYKNATDHANALAVEVLPFVFIAKQDGEKSIREEFSKTWSDNTGGVGAVKLYTVEIVKLAREHLKSARWMVKQTCALALAEAATAIGTDVTKEQLEKLWDAMIAAVAGKSWEGKEKVLDALVNMSVNAGRFIEADADKMKVIEKIVLQEAKRNNPQYRSAALKSLGNFADAFPKLTLFEPVYSVVEAAITPEDDTMDVDEPQEHSRSHVQEVAVINGITSLSKSLRPEYQPSTTAKDEVIKILDMLDKYVIGSNHELKGCSVDAVVRIVKRTLATNVISDGWASVLERLWQRLLGHLTDRNHENGRLKAAAGIGNFGKLPLGDLHQRFREDVQRALAEEKSPMVLQALGPVARLLDG